MCGIAGFTGREKALPFLLQGLSRLEYRGYDSAGITLVSTGGLRTWKTKGRLRELEKIIDPAACEETTGIGHTRWATHGIPSNLNAHPHTNADNTISLVHNGIIENYAPLKKELEEKGYAFQSDTDSEVIVLLLDFYYRQEGSMLKALWKTLARLEGSWALCIVSVFEPDTIYVARKESPMVLGQSMQGTFCASDAPALLSYTKDILPMNDGETAVLKPDGLKLYDARGSLKQPLFLHMPYDPEAAQKGGYDSFMLKEIHEQPEAIRETLRGRIRHGRLHLEELENWDLDWKDIREVIFTACGTAYHACIYGEALFRRHTPVFSRVLPASEFRYSRPRLDEHTLCIAVSQSGETADTIAALKLAKAEGCRTLGIVNVLGSSISRLADVVLYTCAGPEISVASTKAYTTQLVLLHMVVLKMAELMGYPLARMDQRLKDLENLPALTAQTLQMEEEVLACSHFLDDQRDAYFIGRQLDYASALEGALKLKEISYVHADAYYAGELKHGPIALIEKDSVVIAMATQPEVAAKTISNIQETMARGARVILIAAESIVAEGFSAVLRLGDVDPELAAVPSAVLLQLLAYDAAKAKGRDIDKPRNLAKSVTVE